MNFPSTIAEYITGEESAYKTDEVSIFDNFSWNMPTHIQNSISFKHGKFTAASNDPKFKPPFRNIVLTNLRLRYRAEDIESRETSEKHLDPSLPSTGLGASKRRYYSGAHEDDGLLLLQPTS